VTSVNKFGFKQEVKLQIQVEAARGLRSLVKESAPVGGSIPILAICQRVSFFAKCARSALRRSSDKLVQYAVPVRRNMLDGSVRVAEYVLFEKRAHARRDSGGSPRMLKMPCSRASKAESASVLAPNGSCHQ